MSILFSTFAVHKETNFSPPETRIIGKYMTTTISKLSDKALTSLFNGLCEASFDLREELGDDRFKNRLYIELLKLSSIVDTEYFRRQK